MPSETFEDLLDRAASLYGVEPGLLGYLGPPSRHSDGSQAGHSACPWASPASNRRRTASARSARTDAARMAAAGAAGCRGHRRSPDDVEFAAQRRLPNRWGIARTYHASSAKTVRTSEFDVELWEPAADRIDRHGRAHLGAQTGSASHRAAARVSRHFGASGTRARRRALHRDARTRVDRSLPGTRRTLAGIGVSLYGLRSARNWGCGDFRDLHERDRLGGG